MGHWVTYMPHYFLELKWLIIHSLSLEDLSLISQVFQTVEWFYYSFFLIRDILLHIFSPQYSLHQQDKALEVSPHQAKCHQCLENSTRNKNDIHKVVEM